MNRRPQGGQSLVEYLLCCSVLGLALLVPGPDGNNLAAALATALRHYIGNALLLLSIA